MKITIFGDGSFGTFLRELLAADFEIIKDAETVILAVPISAYYPLGMQLHSRHLVNVCSVQQPSTETLLEFTDNVTSIHPLFGRRTPADKRNSIITHLCQSEVEVEFIKRYKKACGVSEIPFMTLEEHDRLMAKTHLAAILAAKQIRPFIEAANDVPDEYIPNSFRLMRDFAKTMEDMPQGTVESILANPYQ